MYDHLKFDKRLINRNIQQKLITKDELASHLEALPDISHKGQTFEALFSDRIAEEAEKIAEAERAEAERLQALEAEESTASS